MPPADELANVILQSVEYGAYPDAEEIAAAELPADAIPVVLSALEKAREEVKSDIRELSHDTAPDVDGWIAQARRLQADIQHSKETAREIVKQAEAGSALRERVDDASSKVNLLEAEVSFNETLAGTLGQIKRIWAKLDSARAAAEIEDVCGTVNALDEVDQAIRGLGVFENTRIAGLLRTATSDLRADIAKETSACWYALVQANSWNGIITIHESVEEKHGIRLDTVVTTLLKLGSLEEHIARFCNELDRTIVTPVLTNGSRVHIEDNSIRLSHVINESTIADVLASITTIIEFLEQRLPQTVTRQLSVQMMPGVISRLTSGWLIALLPASVDGMQRFQDTLMLVSRTAEMIESLNWPGKDDLLRWVQQVPRIWLRKRREAALSEVRDVLSRDTKRRKTVERVETQTLGRDDVIMTGNSHANDDWDAAWEDAPEAAGTSTHGVEPEHADDNTAWDMDGNGHPNGSGAATIPGSVSKNSIGNEDEAEAWDWNEDEGEIQAAPSSSQINQQLAKSDASQRQPVSKERSLTLKETYTATEVPDGIVAIISQIVSDASTLSKPPLSQSPIAPAASGLYTIPTVIVAMFRAISFPYYAPLTGGAMLLYNDTLRLSDLSTSLLQSQTSSGLSLTPDITALQSFAKRVYGKEMESQRTILRDLLDGAQGFTNCTVPPFAGECENAIAMTVDRMREVSKQWSGILSRSALLQSLGSLLATIITKMIVDIEDMSDISEEESKRLRHFCNKVSKLNDLFVQERPGGEKADMTGVYTPNWFKFQYLGEILEASLADIKFLWTEGELRLEFELEELVDLIRALFAESEYRRRAIAEIRRAGRGR